MADQKPPRLHADDFATALALLRYQRESLIKKVEGVDDESARRPAVPSGTSLLWLLKHLSRAETTWFLRRFAGRDVELPSEQVGPDDSVADAIEVYRAVCETTDAVILGAPSLDELTQDTGDESAVNLRWVLFHMLEETARHAGHADIIREQLDGTTGR